LSLPNRIGLAWLAWLTIAASAAAQSPALVLRGATLIDGTDRPPQTDATVVMRNGWIVAAGKRSEVTIPEGARIVDLAGRYLVPGFVDMHGHVAIGAWAIDTSGGKPVLRYAYDEADTRELTRAQLAFGITTVRNPAAPTREAIALRNRTRLGEQVGPRIVTSGAPIDRPSPITATDQVTTESEIRAAVARQAAAGVDFIKLYDGLDSAQIAIAVDEAHKRGLPTVGHLWFTSWTDAARVGIDAITHIIVSNAKLLPASRRAEYLKITQRHRLMYEWFGFVDFDGPEIRELLDVLVSRRITIDPTLVFFEEVAWGDQPDHYPAEASPTPRSRAGTFGVRVRPTGASDRSPRRPGAHGQRRPDGQRGAAAGGGQAAARRPALAWSAIAPYVRRILDRARLNFLSRAGLLVAWWLAELGSTLRPWSSPISRERN